jgi:stage V sporulation protein B
VDPVVDRSLVPSLVRASVPTALYDFLNIGVMQIDLIMLGLYVGHVSGLTLETLGIYAAGVEVALGLRKVSQVFAPIFVPIVARQIAAGDIRQAEASYGYLARWMLAILLPALAVLALAGGAILAIFGEGFRRGAPWMTVAGVACALNAFVGLGESILLVRRPGLNLLNSSIALGATVVLNLWLIPAFGPLGAAIGMLVPYTIQGALRSVEISIIFQWRWPVRALIKPWVAALAGLPLAILLRASVPGLAAEAGAALIYILGYLSAWRVLGLEPSDRAVVAHLW